MNTHDVKMLTLQGYSIRQIADALSVSKYQIEKSLMALRASGQLDATDTNNRPDTPGYTSGQPSDSRPDTAYTLSGQENRMFTSSTLTGMIPVNAQKPSHLNGNLTAFEEDFILRHHRADCTPTEIKEHLEDQFPDHFISVYDIEMTTRRYDELHRPTAPQPEVALDFIDPRAIQEVPKFSSSASLPAEPIEDDEEADDETEQDEEDSGESGLRTLAWVVGGFLLLRALFSDSKPSPLALKLSSAVQPPHPQSPGLDGIRELIKRRDEK